MIRRPRLQDRGNIAEAVHVQIASTSLITEADPTHALGAIRVLEECPTVAATGRGVAQGLQSGTSPVIPIPAPVPTALVESTTATVTDARSSIGVIHAAQCHLDVGMWEAGIILSQVVV